MDKRKISIDLVKLVTYMLKHCWLIVLCAAIGFGYMYWRSSSRPDSYTASGTMFVTNSNPNLVNYGYASNSDISSAVALVNVYSEVVRSESVMQRVLEYRTSTVLVDGTEKDVLLGQKYPWLTTSLVRAMISMVSVNETPMVRISCTTPDPRLSYDICNAMLQVAPAAIKDVVGAGDAKAQDYPEIPLFANGRSDRRQGILGALIGAVAAGGVLFLLFLLNQRVESGRELTDNYTPPILSQIRRSAKDNQDPGRFLLNENSEMDLVESYAKLRMNLLYTISGKEKHSVLVTSAISGEGKSTIAGNLAVSLAMSGKRVLLVDADMRRGCMNTVFHYDSSLPGLSDLLTDTAKLKGTVLRSVRKNLDVLPAGAVPANPAALLESGQMRELLEKLEAGYDLVLLDVPPINIVSDPLALSSLVTGGLFVVRQHYSDHREIRKALISAEMTGLNLLGFVFYGERIRQAGYYSGRFYRGYDTYRKYDTRQAGRAEMQPAPRNE